MKAEYFMRYRFIIEKLQRSRFADYNKIEDYLINKFDLLGFENFQYSLRTFQRDKRDIENIFNIEIDYDRFEKAYFINENNLPDTARKMLDAYTLTNALQIYDDFSEFISLEKDNFGKPGIFYELNEAVKNRCKIKMYYQKYYKENPEIKELKPLALKEFQRRWYLITYKTDETGDEVLRTYGLDRIEHLEILRLKFKHDDFNLNEYFKNFYGIISDINTPFEEVILSFDAFQGKYIKSLPLHHSQEIIEDTENELIIKLKLHITFDFIQKLLSYGDRVKVLQPESLKNEIKNELKSALELYG
ncbi:MAG: WYL domain-containing protein [Chlorobi bacterium]|nr:WYL domain-containing protein [Chlorobiota bacterium]